ncbi:hypothetical protein CRM22_001902 [Opisthorchis felineus]|uniref:Enkurin domain-containing protein n=1 Tax=Opisthorchis felineus TaxID=147828 RepID=A0A4S2M8N9_OPIFE|nr:hypothetical protein CRM22_001902 [Opisthorchis felineus]
MADKVKSKECSTKFALTSPPVGPREYIHNLIPQIRPEILSRYPCLPKIRVDKKKLGDPPKTYPMKTMGPPSKDRLSPVVYPNKHSYMKKQSKKPYVKLVNHTVQDCLRAQERQRAKTAPKAESADTKTTENITADIPQKCLKRVRNNVNWVTRNAISAITAEPGFRYPMESRRQIVDTRKGDKYRLISERTTSGLEPIYVYRKGIGKVPAYIIKRNKMIKETQELLAKYINEKELQATDYLLTDKQREELLTGLKAAWDRYNRKYLGLASINDTLKGKAYKAYLEKQLDSLKEDIELVESHRFLFVEAEKDPSGDGRKVMNHICV